MVLRVVVSNLPTVSKLSLFRSIRRKQQGATGQAGGAPSPVSAVPSLTGDDLLHRVVEDEPAVGRALVADAGRVVEQTDLHERGAVLQRLGVGRMLPPTRVLLEHDRLVLRGPVTREGVRTLVHAPVR